MWRKECVVRNAAQRSALCGRFHRESRAGIHCCGDNGAPEEYWTMPCRSAAPVWLMGLSNAVFGMYGGIMVISVPQLLSARHVPEATIAAMTAVGISPGFWGFLVSPVLDVRFSRRWYSVSTAALAALFLVLALLNLDHLAWVEALLVAGYFFANLYQSALGGWLSSITTAEEKEKLSVW